MSVETRERTELLSQLADLKREVADLESQLAGPKLPTAVPGVKFEPTFQLLIDHEWFPVSCLDSAGNFLFIDKYGASNLGGTPEDIIGRNLRSFFSEADAVKYMVRINQVMEAREPTAFEDLVEVSTGDRWFSSVMHPLFDEALNVVGVQIVSHDITERKRAETSIQERLRFEELITRLASNFVNLHFHDSNRVTALALKAIGSFMSVDRSLLYWFSDNYEYLDCIHEWHDEGVSSATDRLQQQPRDKYPWFFERLTSGRSIIIPKSSQLPDRAAAERAALLQHGVRSTVAVPMRVGGRIVGALVFDSVRAERNWSDQLVARLNLVGDIIANSLERVRAERALAESQQFVHGITEATPYVVFLLDLLSQSVVYVNRHVVEALGYDPEQVIGMGGQIIERLLHPDDRSTFEASILQWIDAADDELIESEYRLARADGEWRWFQFCGRAFKRTPDGMVRQLIVIGQDITSRKIAEEELQQHREHLAHVSRLNTMGEMVAGIAHEMSQPLYSILNFAKACRNVVSDYDDPNLKEVREWLNGIASSATRAGDIINRLRNFVRHSQHSRKAQEISGVLQEAIDLLAFESRNRKVRVSLSGDECFVRVDRVQVQQVVVNLLQNAMESMQDVPIGRRTVQISTHQRADDVLVEVADCGAGIALDSQQIFDAFVTSKPHGMGMGLAISKTIVEEHGGRLWATKNDQQGTVLSFTVPLCTQESMNE